MQQLLYILNDKEKQQIWKKKKNQPMHIALAYIHYN